MIIQIRLKAKRFVFITVNGIPISYFLYQSGELHSTFNEQFSEYEVKWNESADAGIKQLKCLKHSLFQ